MTETFDVHSDIPQELWSLIRDAGAAGGLPAKLKATDRDGILRLFKAFVEAKTEMMDRLVSSDRVAEATEDTVEDLADGLVALGRETYIGVFEGSLSLPPRDTWEKLVTLTSLFVESFDERFEGDIFDAIDELC